MTLGDVTLATRANRQRRAGAAGGAEHHPIADNRRGNHFIAHAAATPELRAGIRVVCLHALLAVDDDLVVIDHANGDRCPPPDVGVSTGAPEIFARPSIERGDERAGELILVEDDAVLVEQRRSSGAVISLHRPEVAMPEQLAVHVHCDKATRTKRRVDTLTVGRRRRRRVAVLVVTALTRSPGGRERLPQLHAIGPAKRDDRDAPAVVVGSGQEDAIAPYDR